MMAALLTFDAVTFGYPTRRQAVLTDFSLEIQPGTVTAILGPNGAGKTTLLHLALGWLRPRAGQVLLAGRALRDYPRYELGQWIGLVPQSEHTPFDYTLLEYVLLGRAPHLRPLEAPGTADVAVAQQALQQVGIEALAHRPVTQLSGGEHQLVLIARALAQQPRLLLLDEPTSHLDLGNKARLLAVLRALRAQGVTVVLTTHEPAVAATIATHLVLMSHGQVQQTGEVGQVLTADALSAIYGTPVSVVEVQGQRVVLWGQ